MHLTGNLPVTKCFRSENNGVDNTNNVVPLSLARKMGKEKSGFVLLKEEKESREKKSRRKAGDLRDRVKNKEPCFPESKEFNCFPLLNTLSIGVRNSLEPALSLE